MRAAVMSDENDAVVLPMNFKRWDKSGWDYTVQMKSLVVTEEWK